jgi:hypothetical protein
VKKGVKKGPKMALFRYFRHKDGKRGQKRRSYFGPLFGPLFGRKGRISGGCLANRGVPKKGPKSDQKVTKCKKWSKTTFLRFEISEKVLEPHGFSGFSSTFGPPFCGSAKPASELPHFHMSF